VCKESVGGAQIECMARCGVGLMLALRDRAVIQLYHIETLDYLQDINVASAITRALHGAFVKPTLLVGSSSVGSVSIRGIFVVERRAGSAGGVGGANCECNRRLAAAEIAQKSNNQSCGVSLWSEGRAVLAV